jgi:hypothetical protein
MLQPHPSSNALRSPNGEILRMVGVLEFQTWVDERGVSQGRSVKPGFVAEGTGGVSVGEGAGCFDGHLENRIARIGEFSEDASLEDLGAVDGADGEVCRGRGVDVEFVAGPVVPFEGRGTRDWFPKIRCNPDAEISGRGIEVRCDDDGLVDVFRGVVEDLPPPVVLDA